MADPSNADDERLVWVSDLVPLLSPTLGEEKSAEVLGVAARKLGLSPPFKPDEARVLLRSLASWTGIVGVAARFATARASTMFRAVGSPVSSQVESKPASRPVDSDDPRRASGRRPAIDLVSPDHRVSVHRLVELLAPSVGQEKSEDVVSEAMIRLGFEGAELDAKQSLRVLELLASAGGIVGVTARFAKARLLLLFPT